MTTYTNDKCLWNDLEHEFAGLMTSRIQTNGDLSAEDKYLEEFYTWVLEYGRGLDQEDYVELVQIYAPNLLKIVEVA